MDGRRFLKCWLSGGLVFAAIGCSRNNVPAPLSAPGIAQPVSGVSMSMPQKSFWGGSGTQQPVAVEMAEPARKGPAKPDTFAALANVQLDAAFDEKTIPSSREGLLDSARAGYQKALQQDPKNKAAMLGLAKYYTRLGEREKAIEMYKKYLSIYPKDKDVAHEVAMAHAQWKDWAGAVGWCEFALKIDPENLTIRKTMAFCLARAGKWEEGFQVMCQVIPEAQARYLMARVLEHQNQPDACKAQLQLAIKADPNFADARDFLAELDQGYGFVPTNNPNSAIRQAGAIEPQEQP